MPLVSTYRKREIAAPEPLPPDWTEHTAPTGQVYYYNIVTQQSTYTRPDAANTFALANPASINPYAQQTPTGASTTQPATGTYISLSDFGGPGTNAPLDTHAPQGHQGHQISRQQFHNRRRNEAFDRPKHKIKIPNGEPWLLVRTKLGRRFAHNPETNESLWRFPSDIWPAVKAMDAKERRGRERRERGEASESEAEAETKQDETGGKIVPVATEEEVQQDGTDSDEYTEVTDSEGEEAQDGGDGALNTSKRQRTSESEPRDDGPVEFDEEDMAYQLQMMEQTQADDDFDREDNEMVEADDANDEEAIDDLSPEDSSQLFKDLLDDFNINPYSPFEKMIEEGLIMQDDRWTALTSMKLRREVWDSWTRESIAALQERKKLVTVRDPKIAYLEFLATNASPKLYWPEFKRKFRKEPVMKETKVAEKETERLVREHVKRLQLSSSTQKADLTALLKSIPAADLNNRSTLDSLPTSMLIDLRYITLPAKIRDPLISTYISTLPSPPSDANHAIAEDIEAVQAKVRERKRREEALRERGRRVEEERRRNEREVRLGRRTLEDEEREIERAMKVGKDGLRGQLRE